MPARRSYIDRPPRRAARGLDEAARRPSPDDPESILAGGRVVRSPSLTCTASLAASRAARSTGPTTRA